MRVGSILALVAAVGLAAVSSGCPADPEPCNDYVPPAGFDSLRPAVSFSNEVLPIFTKSCAFSTCHGATTGPANGVFLGRDGPRVHAAIVGMKGEEHPTMAFVAPGNPRESYLMRKMDGSQCTLDAQCAKGTCESAMPKGAGPLPVATRDIVRRWISQGAKND